MHLETALTKKYCFVVVDDDPVFNVRFDSSDQDILFQQPSFSDQVVDFVSVRDSCYVLPVEQKDEKKLGTRNARKTILGRLDSLNNRALIKVSCCIVCGRSNQL